MPAPTIGGNPVTIRAVLSLPMPRTVTLAADQTGQIVENINERIGMSLAMSGGSGAS
jgi:hypothetical protein